MKGLEYAMVIAGVLAVWYLTKKTQETFVPEFLEQGNVRRTAETATSSYAQQTNHVIPTPPQPEPILGMETPFRVNMFNSYQPD
jgi:molybdenum cofactor biosynthesis enzyme